MLPLRYANDAPEIQQRKLGDLSFLFQHFDAAYNSYNICRRDFNSDHAWLHYAAALVSERVWLTVKEAWLTKKWGVVSGESGCG